MVNLNLLPEEIREELNLSRQNVRLRQWVFYVVALSVFFLALFAVLFFYLLTQKIEATNQKELATKQIDAQNETFKRANDLYTRINLIKKINRDAINWNLVFSELSKQTPANVQMDAFNTNKAENMRIKITGSAQSDKDIVAFKENLSKSEYFNYVDIESISKGVNAQNKEVKIFVISLNLKLDKVKRS